MLVRGRRRGGLRGELLLAVLPTLTVFLALALVDAFRAQRILFASLATSAFLIYLDPRHPVNRIRIVASAHLIGVGLGVAASLVLGAGYLAGGVAMAATILLLITLDILHPPAISTALGFAFFRQQDRAAIFFLLALLMLMLLVLLQFSVLWLLGRLEGDSSPPH
jgi:CBS-domain-containing membrane protein